MWFCISQGKGLSGDAMYGCSCGTPRLSELMFLKSISLVRHGGKRRWMLADGVRVAGAGNHA